MQRTPQQKEQIRQAKATGEKRVTLSFTPEQKAERQAAAHHGADAWPSPMVGRRCAWPTLRLLGACAVSVAALAGGAQGRERATIADLEEEIRQSDLVIRGVVAEIHWQGFAVNAYAQEITCRVKVAYKGHLWSPEVRLFLNLPDWLCPRAAGRPPQAVNVGDELIVPLKEIQLLVRKDGARTRIGPYYTAPSFYPVRSGEITGSPYPLSDELARRRRLGAMERLVRRIVARPPIRFDEYVPGKVLFSDDFNDGSFAGWTFLVGARGGEAGLGHFYGEKWVGPGLRWKNKYPADQRGKWGELVRNPSTGNYEGVCDGAQLQIGVYDGRLRLRSSRLWHHMTAVVGDPNWRDYQVECDVYNHVDRLLGVPKFPQLIAQGDYQEFGVYGRVQVPHLPETRGEHSLIAVEFGTYANEVLLGAMGTRAPPALWHNYFQIRAKWPDAGWERAGSQWLRTTQILDLTAYQIPIDRRIHLKARFAGNRVQGFIDGVKYLDSYLAPLPQIMRRGQIALWVFETWAEFDNVRVTELVRVEKGKP